MVRKILHLDLDAFFCCVEELRDPSLRGKPFAVGGRPEERGVVASCSYAARAFGVRSAMPMSRAVRLCPALIIVPQHRKAYYDLSSKVMSILHDLTPLVEQISIDEAFLDVTANSAPAEEIARELQHTINTRLDLPCSLGVAGNKLVAKIANNVGKDARKQDNAGKPPNAIMVVPAGTEAQFLAPLPTRELWGVGPKTAEVLAGMGILTIGQIATFPEAELVARFGKNGADLAQHARGLDERPLVTEHETKSVSRETTFVRDIYDADTLHKTLRELAEDVSRQLKKEALHGTTIKLKLRWADFRTLTRQTTLMQATNDEDDILKAALRLLDKHWPPGKSVRLIGVGVSHFVAPTPGNQLMLWDAAPDPVQPPPAEPPASEGLRSALDALRNRFGDQSVKRASDLKKPPKP